MHKLVSVIIAVKNGEKFLSKAIESVARSTYRPLEIIVIDGKSTDCTPQIARSYAFVRYFLQVGDGIADAYNTGVDNARGEFIGFLSSDDEWLPDKLALQVAYLTGDPGRAGVVSKIEFFLEDGCAVPPGFRKELLQKTPTAFIMETLLARKTAFDVVGRFNTAYSVAEDVDWFARAKDKGVQIGVIPRVLLRKRVHGHNASLTCPENSKYLLQILRQSIVRGRDQSK